MEFLLGEEVLRLTARDDMGVVIGRLTWRAFLKFEWEARHWICTELNQCRHTLASALQAVKTDQTLRTKFIITPLATSGAAAARSKASSSWETPSGPPDPKRRKKGGGKGNSNHANGGNKGKGKSKVSAGSQPNFTWKMNLLKKWDGIGVKLPTPPCFHFNKKSCDRPGCKWSHVCAYCGAADHGVETCAAFDKYVRTVGPNK